MTPANQAASNATSHNVAARNASTPAAAQRLAARIVWALSGLNLLLVLSLLGLVFVISEKWWLGTAVTYLPRAPWIVPALALSVAGFFWHRPSMWLNLMAGLLVLGPLMELRAPFLTSHQPRAAVSATTPSLRVVSANVQAFKPDFASVLAELNRLRPDVVLFQEAFGDSPLLVENFPDWHRLHVDQYWIGSRYPVTLKQSLDTAAFERTAGLVVEIATPHGPICVATVHQMTARKGLEDLSLRGLAAGESQADFDGFQMLRIAESTEIREQIQYHVGDRPLLVAGDFNTPTSSSIFQLIWGDLTSAFDVAGTGYGYSSPVKTHRWWVDYLPWARIDHILVSPGVEVRDCRIGNGRGSDHHLIYAEIAF